MILSYPTKCIYLLFMIKVKPLQYLVDSIFFVMYTNHVVELHALKRIWP